MRSIRLTTVDPLQFNERKHVISNDVDNTSVAFRLLNKHRRVRLSSKEFDYSFLPGKINMIAIANLKGCFITAIQQQDGFHLACCPLHELRNAFENSQLSSPPFISFQFRTSMKLTGTPCIIKVALNDERLLVGFLDGSVLIYDIEKILENQFHSALLFTIPTKSSNPVKTILPNSGVTPALVAILHSPSNDRQGYQIEIFNVSSCETLVTWCGEDNLNLIPVSVSWSPKGRQIAIGLQSGGLLLYDPHNPNVPKNYFTRPSSVSEEDSSLLSVTWVASHTFYLVYSAFSSCLPTFDRLATSTVRKTHVIFVYDPKTHTAFDIEISDPTPPFGALMPPGPLCLVLKDWSPTKFLLVCGDGPSTDIGAIGLTSDENWSRFTFEETSTPSLPLGESSEDMALLGLDIDLTNDELIRTSEQPNDDAPHLPPAPILYAYMSDGSVVGWYILFLDGTPFPGMLKSIQTSKNKTAVPTLEPEPRLPKSTLSRKDVSESSSTVSFKPTGALENQGPSLFGSTANTNPKITSTASSSSASFGTSSVPTFGVTGWGFGSKPSDGLSNLTGFEQALPSGDGFAAFAKSKPSSFGAPLGASKVSVFSQTPGSLESPPPSPPIGESPANSPVLENIDLLEPTSSHVKPTVGVGAVSVMPADSKPVSSFIKPGSGAFGYSPSGTSAFSLAKPSEISEGMETGTHPTSSTLFTSKRTQPAFGPSGFGAKSAIPTFGVSAFGTKPSIPTFGVSGFGHTPSTAAKQEPSKPSSGGFSAFAGGGFTSFAKQAQSSSFDSLLRQDDSKSTNPPVESGPAFKSESSTVLEGASSMEALSPVEEKQDEKANETAPSLVTATSGAKLPLNLNVAETIKPAVAETFNNDHQEVQRPMVEEHKSIKTALPKNELAQTDRVNTSQSIIESSFTMPTEVAQNIREFPPVIATPKPLTSSSSVTNLNLIGNAPQHQLPHASGLGIGLGRPSSRPARSSPLASTPITLADDEITTVPVSQGISTVNIPVPSPTPLKPSLFLRKLEQSSITENTQQSVPGTVGTMSPSSVIATPKLNTNMDITELNELQAANTHPLQVEFIRTYEEFCGELIDLGKRLEALKVLFPAIQTPRGLEKLVQNNNDFVPGKYSFGDLDPFRSLISKLHEKVVSLLEEGKHDKLRLAEVQNLALISETKREELSRWVKAKQDPEFLKILKLKSLGPEHTENQLRLRKLLQVTLTRLQQCEDTMQAVQKKLNQEKAGKIVFQAPTLDTIDRTCRNIRMALDERTEIVDKLSGRAKAITPRTHGVDLNISPSSPASMPSVNIAVAALNSERSCLSLKNALFKTRNRPLFTEKVTKVAPSAKLSYDAVLSLSSNFPVIVQTSILGSSTNPSSSHDSMDRRRQNRKHVSIAVPLKNSTEKETKTLTTPFDWGPLPIITTTTPKKLPFEFKNSTKNNDNLNLHR